MKIVLASASARRERLLAKVVKKFSVKAASINERMLAGESFSSACVRLAEMKAKKVAAKEKNAIVIGADTIAYRGKKAYKKTDSRKIARRVLSFLSGKTHYVITGVCALFPDGRCVGYSVKAAVKMKKLDAKMISAYLKSGEWRGRAGCYDISGKGKKLVESVRGERETVAGLPLRRLRAIFSQLQRANRLQ